MTTTIAISWVTGDDYILDHKKSVLREPDRDQWCRPDFSAGFGPVVG